MPPDRVGIVTMLDGRPIPSGDLAGPVVAGHESFQCGQAFVNAGGCRGLQEEVLLSGSWNLNPWLVQVEQVPLTEIPIGYVGVVVSYVGREHLDVSGDTFTHGDLVERGRKGVWVEPLLPGKHPVNVRVDEGRACTDDEHRPQLGAADGSASVRQRLSSILVRSKDGFSFSLDVSQIIHIGMRNAPRVISRVGSMQNLVDHVLQPTVGNYFRNSAQQVTVLDFLSARSERQREAFDNVRRAIEAYDVECIDTLIGDIVPPAELMKTQTDRKIAAELQRTYDAQREAEIKRQTLERETAIANCRTMSSGPSRWCGSHSRTRSQRRRPPKVRPMPPACAPKVRRRRCAWPAKAKPASVRAVGAAKAEAYRQGIEAVGSGGTPRCNWRRSWERTR